jgi:hypothetical protein
MQKIVELCIECHIKKVGRNSSNFCSNQCQRNNNRKIYITRWLAGKELGYGVGSQKISNYVKQWLRDTRGNKCEKCGWCEVNPTTGKVPVEGNHKDGNYKNSRPENLELICPNCHSLTPNFRALNKGKGREKRRRSRTGKAPLL